MGRPYRRRRLSAETLEPRQCLTASFGWDGPGQGSAQLSYHIGTAPTGLGQAEVNSAIETALAAWSGVLDVEFNQTNQPNQRNSIDFTFRQIDGPGRTLAQAYFPDDVNPARIAGDVQFDASEAWELGDALGRRAFDLVQVAVHEIGHALGIEHLHESGTVMAPYVSPTQSFASLTPADVDAGLALYAPSTNSVMVVQETTTTNVNVNEESAEPNINHESPDEIEDTELPDTPRQNPTWRPRQWFWWWRVRWFRPSARAQAAPAVGDTGQAADVNAGDNVKPRVDLLAVIGQRAAPNGADPDTTDERFAELLRFRQNQDFLTGRVVRSE